MRANTKKKHEMGKRFAIVIGVAAAGVMALGAQTARLQPQLHQARRRLPAAPARSGCDDVVRSWARPATT